MTLTLTSSAFADGDPIPAVHTCQGADSSPALARIAHRFDGPGVFWWGLQRSYVQVRLGVG